MSETNEVPEWQRKVGWATNTAGMLAGPAAIWMATRQAKEGRGGIPREAVRAASNKFPKNKTLARVRGALRSKPLVVAGGVGAVGLQTANWAGDTIAASALAKKPKEKEPAVKNDQGFADIYVSKSVRTGHGVNLSKANFALTNRLGAQAQRKLTASGAAERRKRVKAALKDMPTRQVDTSALQRELRGLRPAFAKRYYDSEADRQRRLGLYAGAGIGGGAIALDRASREVGWEKGTSASGKPMRALKVTGSKKKLAALAGGGAAAVIGGGYAYRRGVSERNRSWT